MRMLLLVVMMVSACSTVPQPAPTDLRVSSHLLAPPPPLPAVQRTDAGEMTGGDATSSMLTLYDVAGQIRGALIALQNQVRLMVTPAPEGDDAQSR